MGFGFCWERTCYKTWRPLTSGGDRKLGAKPVKIIRTIPLSCFMTSLRHIPVWQADKCSTPFLIEDLQVLHVSFLQVWNLMLNSLTHWLNHWVQLKELNLSRSSERFLFSCFMTSTLYDRHVPVWQAEIGSHVTIYDYIWLHMTAYDHCLAYLY